MSHIVTKISTVHKTEPVVTGFSGLVAALVAVLAIFGVHLTTGQIEALSALLFLAAPVVVWIRSKVTPTPAN